VRETPLFSRYAFVGSLFALFVTHAVAIPMALHIVFGTERTETIVGHIDRFARMSQSEDSWRPMEAARRVVASNRNADLYEEIFFKQRVKFQYAPTSLLYVDGLSRVRLNTISWIAVCVTAAVSALIFCDQMRRTTRLVASLDCRSEMAMAVAALALGFSFYPLIKGYTLGQIQVWVDALFACFVWAWSRGAEARAGVLLGLACLIKPPLAPVAVWALVRGRWQMAAGAAVAAAVGLAASISAYGFRSHLSYARVLAYIASRGETYYPNQSFNGLLNRLFGNGENLEFLDSAFSPPHPWVRAGTVLAAVVLLGLAFALPALRKPGNDRFGLPVVAITATLISPVAWEHHYAILLPLLAVLVPACLDVSPHPRRTATKLGAAFVLTGQYFQIAQRTAATAWNPLQSYLLVGALMFLATAYAAAVSGRQPMTEAARQAS
jgi:alpha-1,2-mannosyltransferase